MVAGLRTDRDVARALKPFIIAEALPVVVEMLRKDGVRVSLSNAKGRTLGYYMPPRRKVFPRMTASVALHTISLQIDLNPYALLFVFVHEWAHLLTQKQYGSEVYPHGKEWKRNFKDLFKSFHSPRIFPSDVLAVIDEYFKKTSRYFESDLAEACERYGKDRQTFARNYMRLLKAGIVIPAPDMGPEARRLVEAIRGKEAGEVRRKPESVHVFSGPYGAAGRDIAEKGNVGESQEKWREAETVKISEVAPGTRIRMENVDYEVVEKLPPFVSVRKTDDGQRVRVHGLVKVRRLEHG